MLGEDLEAQMAGALPAACDVPLEVWQAVQGAWQRRQHLQEFYAAHANGAAFLNSPDALRGRVPQVIEWKGGHKAPEDNAVPVDLRVDHVYLVSCKYASRILLNASPYVLLEHRASDGDWYLEVARDAYRTLYAQVRSELGLGDLPPYVDDLTVQHRLVLKQALGSGGHWPDALQEPYLRFAVEVSRASAAAWKATLNSKAKREKALWGLLRISSAPYFILGSSSRGSMRLRVTTPWDWRRRFKFRRFDVWGEQAGQPKVAWRAEVFDQASSQEMTVEGHVEVRWSHGRFARPPEAKVYLDTPHESVPGYIPLKPGSA